MKNIKATLAVLAAFLALPLVVFAYFGSWGEVLSDPQTPFLPYFVLRSLLRMLIAYFFVVVFGLVYGITAGLYRTARLFMLPLLDILQSIPVLGYLPMAILLFTGALPGELGYEIASIFLIFSGMAWAVTFSILGAVRAIPNDLREASNAFGFRGWKYVRHVVFPAIFPAFITGSILAWGGGWYFLVAAEMLSYGSSVHVLPGIGSFLGSAVFTYGNLPSAFLGLTVFVAVVFAINSFVWKPLSEYAKYFNVQTQLSEETKPPNFSEFGPVRHLIYFTDALEKKYGDSLDAFVARAQKGMGRVARFLEHVPYRRRHFSHPRIFQFSLYSMLFIVTMVVLAYLVASAINSLPLKSLLNSVATHPEVAQLPIFALYSSARIFAAYLIALSWTLVAGIAVARSKRLSEIFMPVFDIGQSTPALALFPFIVILVISTLGGGELSVEVASILLLLTGTQWYLFFNIVGAVKSIPGNVLEASRAFDLRCMQFYTTVVLPAIIPGVLLGSIQAWGGAWNALIVSEYINYGGNVYSVPGLGSFLNHATLAASPDPWVITLAVASMSIIVLAMNYFVWRPLFNYAERFKFENV
ncbi:Binding-protein-dependent transport system inner membrane component [uncultured archaeon]|nr:Binding-protein-dependent transport system inner membrane component [uncultured archaeon]